MPPLPPGVVHPDQLPGAKRQAGDLRPSAVYNWERGRNEPKATQLQAMARLFGVSMDAIDFVIEAAKSAA